MMHIPIDKVNVVELVEGFLENGLYANYFNGVVFNRLKEDGHIYFEGEDPNLEDSDHRAIKKKLSYSQFIAAVLKFIGAVLEDKAGFHITHFDGSPLDVFAWDSVCDDALIQYILYNEVIFG